MKFSMMKTNETAVLVVLPRESMQNKMGRTKSTGKKVSGRWCCSVQTSGGFCVLKVINYFLLFTEESPSFMDFFKVELTRGYILEHDEERYTARRQKIYSFMRIPRDLERFIVYGIMQCADSFLYIHTFLPVRFVLATWALFSRPIASCLGLRRRSQRLLTPAEICDLLKGLIWIACTFLMLSVDTNRVYHIIKSQSIIKLYIFYNMIEVGDRLLSAFGQDTIDALFWTATEPKNSKREHFGLLTHIVFALIYVLLHSFLIMFQVCNI